MTRLEYLRSALLFLLQAIFLPEQPAKAVQPSYEHAIEQIEMTRLHEQHTPQADAPTVHSWEEWCREIERHTDELDVLVKELPTGHMMALWNRYQGKPHQGGETFTEQLRAIRKPPQ